MVLVTLQSLKGRLRKQVIKDGAQKMEGLKSSAAESPQETQS